MEGRRKQARGQLSQLGRLWLRGVVGGLLFVASSCGSCSQGVRVNLPVLRAKLDNGLRLVLVPDEKATKVQVDVRHEVGANDDPEGEGGTRASD